MLREHLRIHRQRLSRLAELAVEARPLSEEELAAALARFASTFVGEASAPAFLAEALAARAAGRELEIGKWLWAGSPLPALRPRFGWLSDWHSGVTCVRFDRRLALPALALPVASMLDEWAFSWPGAYVSFETSRAVVVSLDYEVACFDLTTRPASPYR